MVGVPVVMQRDASPVGYRIESSWGTDPLVGNLGILGLVRTCKVTIRQNREPGRGVGSGVDPRIFRWKGQQVTVDLEYEMQDDNPANSFLALALGDAPNGATGAITNRPNSTNKNLRSFTMELGFDSINVDEYWQIVGCMVRRLEDRWDNDTLVRKVSMQGKIAVPPTTTPAMTPPALSQVSLFDPFLDGSITFTNPTIATHLEDGFSIVIENVLKGAGTIGGGRGLGYLQIAGRNVYVDLDAFKTGSEFVSQFFSLPNSAAAQLDITATLLKTGGAEYIQGVLTDCEIVGEGGPEAMDTEDEWREKWRFQSKAYSFDVKA